MSTVVGRTEFKYEKSTLKVSFLWKCDGHSFQEYFDFMNRCKSRISSTEEIRFQSGFLASTNHYAKCYVTHDDGAMYMKIYLEDTELPSEFTNSEVSVPRVSRQLDYCNSADGFVLSDALKNNLIAKGRFFEEDFSPGKCSKVYWLSWSCNGNYKNDGSFQPLLSYNGDTITLNFEFDYCFWNRKRKSMQVSVPGDGEDSVLMNDGVGNASTLCTKKFFVDPKFSDFIIQCGAKSFHSHRMVISSKSVVLAAMLENPLKEMKEGKLIIEDFEPEVFEEFLRFIYTGNANVDAYAAELFKLSHKYEVTGLKRMSETALISQVDGSNLINMNELGKLYGSQRLQDKCYSFFKCKRSTLLKTKADVDKFSDFLLRGASE